MNLKTAFQKVERKVLDRAWKSRDFDHYENVEVKMIRVRRFLFGKRSSVCLRCDTIYTIGENGSSQEFCEYCEDDYNNQPVDMDGESWEDYYDYEEEDR